MAATAPPNPHLNHTSNRSNNQQPQQQPTTATEKKECEAPKSKDTFSLPFLRYNQTPSDACNLERLEKRELN
jgi:hypothetical protein